MLFNPSESPHLGTMSIVSCNRSTKRKNETLNWELNASDDAQKLFQFRTTKVCWYTPTEEKTVCRSYVTYMGSSETQMKSVIPPCNIYANFLSDHPWARMITWKRSPMHFSWFDHRSFKEWNNTGNLNIATPWRRQWYSRFVPCTCWSDLHMGSSHDCLSLDSHCLHQAILHFFLSRPGILSSQSFQSCFSFPITFYLIRQTERSLTDDPDGCELWQTDTRSDPCPSL